MTAPQNQRRRFTAVSLPNVKALPPKAAIQTLYIEHHRWLVGWLRGRLGAAGDAADLAQDAFLRLLIKPHDFDCFDAARAYLRTVAKGLCIDLWRRRQIEPAWLELLAAQPEAHAPSAEQHAIVLEALCQLDAMLQRLPQKAAHAFLMAQIDGRTYTETAAQLGVSERMVKKYMAQAMLHCVLIEAGLAPVAERQRMQTAPFPAPDRAALEEAAQWFALLPSDAASVQDREAWRAQLDHRPVHREAWHCIEAISARFEPLRVPEQRASAGSALRFASSRHASRRQVLRGVGFMAAGGLLGWSAWRHGDLQGRVMAYAANYGTGTGEMRAITLADGTRVWLNTDSALDAELQPALRRLRLQGLARR